MKNLGLNTSSNLSGPLQANERLELIDILRTIALLGIFIVNIQFYRAEPGDKTNLILSWLIKIFVEGSFYPLFSILFGIGFVIILSRTEKNGKPNLLLFIRRLFVLAIIASLQFILLEPRHILFRYSLLGLPLITFYGAPRKVLIYSITFFFLISVFHTPIIHTLDRVKEHSAGSKNTQTIITNIQEQETAVERGKNNWEEYSNYTSNNAKLLITQVINLTRDSTMPHIFACFLLGIFIWKTGIFQRLYDYRHFLRYCVIFCGLFGVVGNIGLILLEWNGLTKTNPVLTSIFQTIGDSLLTICYMAAIALLWLNTSWAKLMRLVKPAGRMGLTNYLLQSVVMSLIFLNYGLNLKGKLSVAECVVVVILSTVIQIILSAWWFNRFKYGPVEWVWRLLIYGRLIPIRNK